MPRCRTCVSFRGPQKSHASNSVHAYMSTYKCVGYIFTFVFLVTCMLMRVLDIFVFVCMLMLICIQIYVHIQKLGMDRITKRRYSLKYTYRLTRYI